MTPWRIAIRRKTSITSIAPRMAPVTPRYLPTIRTGRGTGLLTMVRTVLFSISRLITAVARKPARMAPRTKMVANPMSSNNLLSPTTSLVSSWPMAKPVLQVLKTWRTPESSTTSSSTG